MVRKKKKKKKVLLLGKSEGENNEIMNDSRQDLCLRMLDNFCGFYNVLFIEIRPPN